MAAAAACSKAARSEADAKAANSRNATARVSVTRAATQAAVEAATQAAVKAAANAGAAAATRTKAPRADEVQRRKKAKRGPDSTVVSQQDPDLDQEIVVACEAATSAAAATHDDALSAAAAAAEAFEKAKAKDTEAKAEADAAIAAHAAAEAAYEARRLRTGSSRLHSAAAGGGTDERGGPSPGTRSDASKKAAHRRKNVKKYLKFQWAEPRQGRSRYTTRKQGPHMDVNARGYGLVVALNKRQPFDVYPESALPLAMFRDVLLPLYDDASRYYKENIHDLWTKWNPGRSEDDGMATYWAFICHRLFVLEGVPLLWRRKRLWLEAGDGVAVTNHILHGGADHDGDALYRLHMYMTESTKIIARDVSAAPVEDSVFDFRVDKKWFVVARYLALEPSQRVNLIPQLCKLYHTFAYPVVCFVF